MNADIKLISKLKRSFGLFDIVIDIILLTCLATSLSWT